MSLVLRLLILLDCCINRLIGGNINETLSACAHRMRVRRQPYWQHLAGVIDALFFWQQDHCEAAWRHEQAHGGALSYWLPAWCFRRVW